MISKVLKYTRKPLIFLICLLIAGCFPNGVKQIPKNTDNETHQFTNTPSQLTGHITITPTKPIIPTQQVSISPDPLMLPTYSVQEAKEAVLNYLQDNGGCEFPCLWGIDPRKSSLNHIEDVLSRFNKVNIPNEFVAEIIKYENQGGLTSILWNERLRTFVDFSYYINNGLIENIVLYAEFTQELEESSNINPVFGNPYFSEQLKYYVLPQIVDHYGSPTKILILPFTFDKDEKDYQPIFSLVLIYETDGFLAQYLFPNEVNGINYYGCPSKTAYISIVAWNPKTNPALEKMVQHVGGLGISHLTYPYFKALEDVTTMQKGDFVQSFLNMSEDTCITTPIDKWP